MKFQIDSSSGPHIGIVTLTGRVDARNCTELQNSFMSWLMDTSRFVFDCSGLEFIDSSGLGTIVSCLRKALDHNGDLKLAALSPKVSMVLELTKASKLFSIFPDASEAVNSYVTGTKE
ncbi:MAG: STAS domain-containing protein [Chlorobiaceae bacterium]|nr:STAS domain-containing protein [Chlorobiaceae bacterium]NTV60833.1 STAS domain-containing protein [Chlorobiaceae bacterium]